jgi:hypothetical protein
VIFALMLCLTCTTLGCEDATPPTSTIGELTAQDADLGTPVLSVILRNNIDRALQAGDADIK